MIKLASSDHEVELWLAEHRQDVASATTAELLQVAEWLPIIGIPANDRKSDLQRERVRPHLRVVPADQATSFCPHP